MEEEVFSTTTKVPGGHAFLNEPGTTEIDYWRMDYDFHNGPECVNCEERFCHHCQPHIYAEQCPGSPNVIRTTLTDVVETKEITA